MFTKNSSILNSLRAPRILFSPVSLIIFIYFITCYFLSIEITHPVLVIGFFFSALRFFSLKINKILFNFIFIATLAGFLWKVQFEFSPETVLLFLVLVTSFKILQTSHLGDFHFTLQTLLLLVGGTGLFLKRIEYLVFAFFMMILIINLMNCTSPYYFPAQFKKQLKKLFTMGLASLPLVAILFIVFPRYRFTMDEKNENVAEGEIGYSTEVNNSQIEGLNGNSSPLVRVYVTKEIESSRRYLRGRILDINDGYNWRRSNKGQQGSINLKMMDIKKLSDDQKITLKYFPLKTLRNDYFILDYPADVDGSLITSESLTQAKFFSGPKSSYQATSLLNEPLIKMKDYSNYLTIDPSVEKLRPYFRKKLGDNFKHANHLIAAFKKYLDQENFQYSLRPGKTNSLADFLKKKKGFCTHYASLLGNIFRLYGFPSRLVNGLQGGSYHPYDQFYLFTQNDAHTWNEYFDIKENKWRRVDPTFMIAPHRIEMGGEEFMLTQNSSQMRHFFSNLFGQIPFFTALNKSKMYLAHLNFKTGAFLEEFNLTQQQELLSKLNLSKKQIYLFSLAALLSLILLYYYFYGRSFQQQKNQINHWDLYWQKLRLDIQKIHPQLPLHLGPASLLHHLETTTPATENLTEIIKKLKIYLDVVYAGKENNA